jgi:hypothetical protein
MRSLLLSSEQLEATMAREIGAQDYEYAVGLVHSVCCFAGNPCYLEDIWSDLRTEGIGTAIADHDSPALFNWLMTALSYQGIANRVAAGFIEQYGNIQWSDIERALAQPPSCPKLKGYWTVYGCGYRKGSASCAEPEHIAACPLPRHYLRNGNLNQAAYSLFFFIRDIAGGDLVTWIDDRLAAVNPPGSPTNLSALRDALITPLRNVHGVSDKVLAMALSSLLLAAGKRRKRWFEVGASFIVVDTLVHNFLHRTGILHRFNADHPYGPACYRPGGCADILQSIAAEIDATAFNPAFPMVFPRFVQHAVWAYCAENGLDVCNGNRIDDAGPCDNVYCRLHRSCGRVALKPLSSKIRRKITHFQ